MSDQKFYLMVTTYPVTGKDSARFVSSFRCELNGEIIPNFTGEPNKAQRFGPEVRILFPTVEKYGVPTLINVDLIQPLVFDDGKNYNTVDIAVIATRSEYHSFWEKCNTHKHEFKQDSGGNLIAISKLDGELLYVAPLIHVVDGVRVLFVEPTSDVVSYSRTEAWIKSKIGADKKVVHPEDLYQDVKRLIRDKK